MSNIETKNLNFTSGITTHCRDDTVNIFQSHCMQNFCIFQICFKQFVCQNQCDILYKNSKNNPAILFFSL